MISFIWDFGDNFGISHESNPSYSYKTPGLFTIILIVIDLDGDNSTFIQYIQILENSDNIFLNINKTLTYSLIFSFLSVSIFIVYSKIKKKNISKKISLTSLKL